MMELKKADVVRVNKIDENLQEIILDIDHPCKKAINYIKMTGCLKEGDTVLVNTTACTLNLGTGGFHYIMGNFNSNFNGSNGIGHGMKLKYTPNQVKVLFSEEQDSPLHSKFHKELNLKGKLIFIGELHSMLVPLCAHLKYKSSGGIKVACIITDHGALPVWFSKNIGTLRSKRLLDMVITIGNAFGGDHECVNIYTALQLAANIQGMDAVVITMGPGIMGTGTPFGFSGLDLGFYLDLCYKHGGIALCVPRISFRDSRDRHYGISHHFINIFREIIQNPLPIILPIMKKSKVVHVINQLRQSNLMTDHPVIMIEGKGIIKSLSRYQLNPTTMGRGFGDDPEFFYAHGAIVEYGLSQL